MRTNLKPATAVVFLLFIALSFPLVAQTQSGSSPIESKFATVEGVKIHYLTAG